MFTVRILHPMDTICQEVLSSQLYASREVIDLLVFAQALEEAILE